MGYCIIIVIIIVWNQHHFSVTHVDYPKVMMIILKSKSNCRICVSDVCVYSVIQFYQA
jgi:hypothetical protein